jgi:hypothetical protein
MEGRRTEIEEEGGEEEREKAVESNYGIAVATSTP